VGVGFGATSAMAGSLMSMRVNAGVLVSSPASHHRLHPADEAAANEANDHRLAVETNVENANGGYYSVDTPGLAYTAEGIVRLGWGEAADPLSPAMGALVVGGGGGRDWRGGGREPPHTFGHGSWLHPPQAPKHPPPSPGQAAHAPASATPPAWRPAQAEGELKPLALHEVLNPREVRAMTHARARDHATRASAARMYGDGLTRGFSAAHGQRGAEVTSPWGAAAATSGRMFLRAGEDAALAAPSVHESDWGQVASRSSAPRHGFVERRIFSPAQPPMTDSEAEAAARHPRSLHQVDQYVDSVYGGGGGGGGGLHQQTPEIIISKHQYASRYLGKVMGGYGEAPHVDPATGYATTFDGTIRDAGEYAQRRARLLHDTVAGQEVAGDRSMGQAVSTLMNAQEDKHGDGAGGMMGAPLPRVSHAATVGGTSVAASAVTKSQVTEVVDKVKEARRLSRAGVAGQKMAAGQPRVETAIMAATAAPEFREHLWEAGGAGDVVGGMGAAAADEHRSRGRTPTGGFADDRRAPPRGLGLPSNVFSPLKLHT
jgi:hypothetical protein